MPSIWWLGLSTAGPQQKHTPALDTLSSTSSLIDCTSSRPHFRHGSTDRPVRAPRPLARGDLQAGNYQHRYASTLAAVSSRVTHIPGARKPHLVKGNCSTVQLKAPIRIALSIQAPSDMSLTVNPPLSRLFPVFRYPPVFNGHICVSMLGLSF